MLCYKFCFLSLIENMLFFLLSDMQFCVDKYVHNDAFRYIYMIKYHNQKPFEVLCFTKTRKRRLFHCLRALNTNTYGNQAITLHPFE